MAGLSKRHNNSVLSIVGHKRSLLNLCPHQLRASIKSGTSLRHIRWSWSALHSDCHRSEDHKLLQLRSLLLWHQVNQTPSEEAFNVLIKQLGNLPRSDSNFWINKRQMLAVSLELAKVISLLTSQASCIDESKFPGNCSLRLSIARQTTQSVTSATALCYRDSCLLYVR